MEGQLMSKPTAQPSDPRVGLAAQRTGMASFRTGLALNRTTLAWIRTTLTMASHGQFWLWDGSILPFVAAKFTE